MLLVTAAASSSAVALDIRGYTASRHDRFTGFPASPVLNPSSFYDGSRFTGLGWSALESQRQFALISPRHFVMATHWGISPGQEIRFLSASGTIVSAYVDSTTPVTVGMNTCDLTFGRFTADIPGGSGVTPFPYLNVGSESNARYSNLQVFGFQAKAGTGRLADFSTEALSGSTRMLHFTYNPAGGGQDDCQFVVGDSGSPTFALKADGSPILVGTHSAVGSDDSLTYNFDTYVPNYITEINALMAPDGYAMTPAYATATSVSSGSTATTSPATLRRSAAGTASFTLQRSGMTSATNVTASLTFPSGLNPASVSGTGWTVDVAGPLVWKLHRSSLPTGTTTLVATWTSIPLVSSIPVVMEWTSDGSQQRSREYDLAPQVSYAEWSAPLAQPATNADPDSDGRTNLIEYAFGGDPSAGTNLIAPGVQAGTAIMIASGTASLKFPVRSDSQVRGLTYLIEWSDNLTTWSTTAPGGASAPSYQAYAPAVSGFKESLVTFPANAARKFARVRVTLNENAAGMTVP